MNIKLLRSRRFELALPILFAASFGGCATQQTPVQTAEAQVAQPVKAQMMRLVVQRPSVRQVYKGVVAALTFSPDSKTLASAGSTAKNSAYIGAPGGLLKVEMLDVFSLRAQKTLPLLPAANFVAFSPDLNRIVINPTLLDGLQLIDATNGKSLWQQYTQHPDWPPLPNGASAVAYICDLGFSPRGDKVLDVTRGQSGDMGRVDWSPVEAQKIGDTPEIPDLDLDPDVYAKEYWGRAC